MTAGDMEDLPKLPMAHDMDTYAADVAELTQALDLKKCHTHWSLNRWW